jgi:hypothetical protein
MARSKRKKIIRRHTANVKLKRKKERAKAAVAQAGKKKPAESSNQ